MKRIFLALAILACTDLASHAQTQGELARHCKADLRKFCKNVHAGSSRLLQCLRMNGSLISAECSQTLRKMKR
ncbi:MAG: hypothetical protein KF735_24665 [Chelatococcus sp.]|uniref:cysteine rich repeat-containing protein n=1 Tax=Chelatococcus sp. TaxID=1953771 RepID=UPI001BCFAE1F|nr:hypothetical protein [Chelatococcus sp. HY11]MBX3540857.1 hypothetical protein [Chelatococcus sp.]MBX3545386.1 hypothetical protein [Chelatococcus sp.]